MTTNERLRDALPGYTLGTELAWSPWGVVYRAVHRDLGRPVAVKQLPPELASDPRVRARFAAKAQVLAGFDHPHIVPIYDFVEEDGCCALVMELLAGGSALDRLGRGITPEAACAITLAVTTALDYAHARGVLHQDLRPENVLFSEPGAPKLTDFAVAEVLGDRDGPLAGARELLGNPAYLAPEQLNGGVVSRGTDVWAAGVLLYELLSQRLPFGRGGTVTIRERLAGTPPIPLGANAPHVEAFQDVITRALASDPADRFADATAFALALVEVSGKSLGEGWLARSGVPVQGSGPALDAALRNASRPATPSGTDSRATAASSD